MLRIAKSFISAYPAGLLFTYLLDKSQNLPTKNNLARYKQLTSQDYTKITRMGSEVRLSMLNSNKKAGAVALTYTVWKFLHDMFMDCDYSNGQSAVRATAVISPIIVFTVRDRPYNLFWYECLGLGLVICNYFSQQFRHFLLRAFREQECHR